MGSRQTDVTKDDGQNRREKKTIRGKSYYNNISGEIKDKGTGEKGSVFRAVYIHIYVRIYYVHWDLLRTP